MSIRRPSTPTDTIKSVDMKGGKIVVKAGQVHIRSAIAHWILSKENDKHKTKDDKWEAEIYRRGDTSIVSGILNRQASVGAINDDNVIQDAIRVTIEEQDVGHLVTVRANIPQYVKQSVEGVNIYNTAMIEESLLTWIENNPRKVELGYGPDHPLDDIHPNAVEPTYVPSDDANPQETFREWFLECHRRTASMGIETAAYLDDSYNMVGILEGGRRSVQYPAMNKTDILMNVHTHPELRNLALPSERDLEAIVSTQPIAAVSAIILSNGHPAFYSKEEGPDEATPVGGQAQFPFDKLPVALVYKRPANDLGEIREHHNDQQEKMEKMAGQQMAQKVDAINSIEDQISDGLYHELKEKVNLASVVRNKAVRDKAIWEKMNELGYDNDSKFTIQQVMLEL